MNVAPEVVQQWREVGLSLGYPVCCIKAFCEKPLATSRDWHNPWEGTGYVPCPVCALLPMMTIQGRINALREPCHPPFPSVLV